MKIAIYLEQINQYAGGGFTFQSSILNAISDSKAARKYEFILVSRNTRIKELFGLKVVSLSDYSGESGESKNTRVSLAKYSKNISSKILGKPSKSLADYTRELELQFDDLIISQGIRAVWFISLEMISVNVPFIATVWDLQHRLQPLFPEVSTTGWNWTSRESNYSQFLPRASAIIVGTARGKNEVINFYSVAEENVHVIPFSIPEDIATFHRNTEVEVDVPEFIKEKYLLYPAQFWPHKNHVGLLDALAIQERSNEVLYESLVFVGSDKGNMAYIKDYVKKLHLKTKIHFLGFIDRLILLQLYKHATLLVFPSFFGPDNIPPLEAIGIGCPACVADVPGAREQLGEAAMYFDPSDPKDIAETINYILQMEPNELDNMMAMGKALCDRLTSEAYLNNVNNILDELGSKINCWGTNYMHTE